MFENCKFKITVTYPRGQLVKGLLLSGTSDLVFIDKDSLPVVDILRGYVPLNVALGDIYLILPELLLLPLLIPVMIFCCD